MKQQQEAKRSATRARSARSSPGAARSPAGTAPGRGATNQTDEDEQ
ncbi:MAG: hypothetical protein AVDCRST_MAG42-3163 [uncultured Chthoniobacterales bacterium]|uniref:Uncharacterized protein n=1 Tax=uncultured Chthoniobacterales bacterium TaxID=1836801 RepID=A0A6J4J1V7_9BACT|nr:MAG: hypothetical protein AVDCRST_MAG42-3163 [uncultured Chthoniobacterales bacterium]